MALILAGAFMVVAGCRPGGPARSRDARDYLEAKARFVRDGKSDSSRAYVLAAMHDLELRLRKIIGPVDLQGRPSTFNPAWLTREGTEGGELDAILFRAPGTDTTILVTVPELVAEWLRLEGDTAEDPLVALADPIHLQWAVSFNAAFYRYIDIGRKAPLPAGVRLAHVVAYSQDNVPVIPSELLVIAEYSDLVFLVLMPAAKLTTPDECTSLITAGVGWRHIAHANEQAYLSCIDRAVPEQPQFQQLVAQVESLAKLLRQVPVR